MSVDAFKEFLGETREQAIAKAVTHFGVGSADDLEVREAPGALGVAGLGGRALLLVSTRGAQQDAPERPRERRRERPSRPERPSRADRPERGLRSDRGDRPELAPRSDRSDRPRPARSERGERSERAPRSEAPQSLPSTGAALEIDASGCGPVGEFLEGLLQRMGAEGQFRITESGAAPEVMIQVAGDGAAELARISGLPAAISHLAHRAAPQLLDDDEASAHVEFERSGGGDVDSETESHLESQTREIAEEVSRTGEPQLLEPMNARDRFIVHNVVRDIEGVTSESVTEGRDKRVEIRPD